MSNENIAVIILNWNNALDTIECLETVLKSEYSDLHIFLVDNASQDDSVAEISDWLDGGIRKIPQSRFPELINPLNKKPISHQKIKVKIINNTLDTSFYSSATDPLEKKITFILNSENIGFARGNNEIINWIIQEEINFGYYYLLNNDTVIKPSTISRIIENMVEHKVNIANSTIYEYFNPDIVSFGGGLLKPWGAAKYFFSAPQEEIRLSEFAHGCALMVKKEIFEKHGNFTEKFFHGEEDFDFGWRMKKQKEKIICVRDSVVYHKDGISIEKYLKNKQRLALSMMNRIVDMKFKYNRIVWNLWRVFASFYYIKTAYVVKRIKPIEAIKIIWKILVFSNSIDCVDKKVINRINKEI